MILKLLFLLCTLLTAKVIYNLYYFLTVKYYYSKYVEYVKGSKSWFVKEHKQRIINLLEKAGIKDTHQPNVEPAGYGMLSTGNISVFQNLAVLREDIVTIINGDFREALGIYKQRIFESLNPVYWSETFLQLPKLILEYLGIKPESIFVKIVQLIWLALAAISILVGIFFNNDFKKWVFNIWQK